LCSCVVVASASLLFASAIPLGLESLTDPITILIAVTALVLVITKRADSVMIIGASGALSVASGALSVAVAALQPQL
jgi:hypothetical protein